jgi:Fe(3+) dicitrate transport protein
MKRNSILLFLLLTTVFFHVKAQTFAVRGHVKTAFGEGIAHASVVLANTAYLSVCDSSGNYRIKRVKPGTYTLEVSAIGYKPITRSVTISENLVLHFVLADSVQQLSDVNVRAEREKTFGITRMNAVEGTTINAGKKKRGDRTG